MIWFEFFVPIKPGVPPPSCSNFINRYFQILAPLSTRHLMRCVHVHTSRPSAIIAVYIANRIRISTRIKYYRHHASRTIFRDYNVIVVTPLTQESQTTASGMVYVVNNILQHCFLMKQTRVLCNKIKSQPSHQGFSRRTFSASPCQNDCV
jgi:hypothetical protein